MKTFSHEVFRSLRLEAILRSEAGAWRNARVLGVNVAGGLVWGWMPVRALPAFGDCWWEWRYPATPQYTSIMRQLVSAPTR